MLSIMRSARLLGMGTDAIEYVASDARRQVIPYVRLKDRSGNVREYALAGRLPRKVEHDPQHGAKSRRRKR